jgi:SAM-dependent methyltransferase
MVEDPPSVDDIEVEEIEDIEVEEASDDDLLSSTMESPLDAESDAATRAMRPRRAPPPSPSHGGDGKQDGADGSPTPPGQLSSPRPAPPPRPAAPSRPPSVPPRPQSVRPPAPLPAPSKVPLIGTTRPASSPPALTPPGGVPVVNGVPRQSKSLPPPRRAPSGAPHPATGRMRDLDDEVTLIRPDFLRPQDDEVTMVSEPPAAKSTPPAARPASGSDPPRRQSSPPTNHGSNHVGPNHVGHATLHRSQPPPAAGSVRPSPSGPPRATSDAPAGLRPPSAAPSSPRAVSGAPAPPSAPPGASSPRPPSDAPQSQLTPFAELSPDSAASPTSPDSESTPTNRPPAGAAPEARAAGGDELADDLALTQKLDPWRAGVPGPPGIPSLMQPERGPRGRDKRGAGKKKGRKGKRRTVRIPDDHVPVPTPAGAAPWTLSNVADPEGWDEDDDDDISDQRTMVLPEKVDVDDLKRQTESRGVALGATPMPPPMVLDDAEDDGPTRQSAPGIFTDVHAIAVLRPITIVNDLPPLEEETEIEPEPLSPRDENMLALPLGAQRRPPPPRRTDRPKEALLDEIEEIVPERMSLPTGMIPDAATSTVVRASDVPSSLRTPTPEAPSSLRMPDMSDLDARSQRRPLPPPRSAMASDPDLLASVDIESAAPAFPTGLDALRAAEAEALAAEAVAREAEARAREAEARAREAEAKAEAARKKPPKKPWWIEFFEDDYVLTLDNPKRKHVQRDVDFIEQSLALDKGSRVLDLGCGHGVHAVELASRSYQVVGVDVSSTMLTLAKDYNLKRGTSVSFIQGDMRELNLEEVFDGIFCWSTTFGYFDDQRNVDVLERVARALRPGGRFVLDVHNRDYISWRQPSMAWFEKPGCTCMDEVKVDFYTSRLVTKRMVMFDNGKSKEIEMSIRLYTLHELGRVLTAAGFRVLEVSGHLAHRGAYFGCESPRIIITAERRGTDG